MKNRLAIFASLTAVGAGIWYLFFRNQSFLPKEESDPAGVIHREENGHKHIRQVLHKAKANMTEHDDNGALIS
jgi:hypothetical protein